MIESRAQLRKGFVLITVLLVVSLLTLAAYKFGDLMTTEHKAAVSYVRSAKAKAFAASGFDYTAMILADPLALETQGGNIFQNPTVFQSVIIEESDIAGLEGQFSIVSPLGPDQAGQGGATQFRYGCTDEAGKINLNGLLKIDPTGDAAVALLEKLPNMTPDLAASIVDWLDPDDEPRTGGAEVDSYAGLGYRPRNGPLTSLEELLYVIGMTPEILFGNDRNRNGILDAEDYAQGEELSLGLAAYLTVYSREQNVDSEGNARIYLNDRDRRTLYNTLGEKLDEDLVKFIMAYRSRDNTPVNVSAEDDNSNVKPAADMPESALGLRSRRSRSIGSIFDLVDRAIEVPGGRGQPSVRYASPLNSEEGLKDLLPMLFDLTTTTRDTDLPVRININTAPRAVIQALPGVNEDMDLVQKIIEARPDPLSQEAVDPIFSTPAWLIAEADVDATVLRTLERFITARSQVYRFQAIGHFTRGGPARRIEAIVDTNRGRPRIVYWRDLTELGRGFNLSGPE